jgi:nascent polypeptide-associated complex subunit beta
MPIDQAKLKALKANGPSKVGGQRVATHTKSAGTGGAATGGNKAAAEIVTAINRLGGRAIPKVTEACIFLPDDKVQIFKNPKVTAAVQANTWAIQGKSVTKGLAESMTEVLQHMGMDNLNSLQAMVQAMGNMPGMPPMPGMGGDMIPNFDEVEDEEAPELVE